MKTIISVLILTITLIASVVGYIMVFSHFDVIWFNFTAIFYLCGITFFAGSGICVSAILIEKQEPKGN